MGEYLIEILNDAKDDLRKIHKRGKKAEIVKLEKIFAELKVNPESGIGNPERLKYQEHDIWSRRINKKDRLIYEIRKSEKTVIVLSLIGHYSDK